MSFKNPNLTIEAAGSLPAYIDAVLAKRGVSNGWEKFTSVLGYRYFSTRSRAKELGIAVNTFKHWKNLYEENQNATSENH